MVMEGVAQLNIEFCMAYTNGQGAYRGRGASGILIRDSIAVRVRYCQMWQNKAFSLSPGAFVFGGAGITLDVGVRNAVVEYCATFENEGPGVEILQWEGARFISENVTLRFCASSRDAQRVGIANYVISSAMMLPAGEQRVGMHRVFVYANSVFARGVVGQQRRVAAIGASVRSNATAQVLDLLVFSNLFIADGPDADFVHMINFNVTVPPTISMLQMVNMSDNAYHASGGAAGAASFIIGGRAFYTLLDWANITLQEGGLSTEAFFGDPGVSTFSALANFDAVTSPVPLFDAIVVTRYLMLEHHSPLLRAREPSVRPKLLERVEAKTGGVESYSWRTLSFHDLGVQNIANGSDFIGASQALPNFFRMSGFEVDGAGYDTSVMRQDACLLRSVLWAPAKRLPLSVSGPSSVINASRSEFVVDEVHSGQSALLVYPGGARAQRVYQTSTAESFLIEVYARLPNATLSNDSSITVNFFFPALGSDMTIPRTVQNTGSYERIVVQEAAVFLAPEVIVTVGVPSTAASAVLFDDVQFLWNEPCVTDDGLHIGESAPLNGTWGACASVAHDAFCNVSCDPGFSVSGAARQCRFGGFVGPVQTCEPAACPIAHISVVNGSLGTCDSMMTGLPVPHGANCSFSCDPGFRLFAALGEPPALPGGGVISCAYGELYGLQRCLPDDWCDPLLPESGALDPDGVEGLGSCALPVPNGDNCTVACTSGYHVRAGDVMVCNGTGGALNGSTPACLGNPCDAGSALGPVGGGSLGSCDGAGDGLVGHNTTCSIACGDDFVVHGAPYLCFAGNLTGDMACDPFFVTRLNGGGYSISLTQGKHHTVPSPGTDWAFAPSASSVDDAPFDVVPLNFSFPWWDRYVDTVHLSPNGGLHFGQNPPCCVNSVCLFFSLPSPLCNFDTDYRDMILPWVTDLLPNPGMGTKVSYTANVGARALHVSYSNATLFFRQSWAGSGRDETSDITVSLFESGLIRLSYERVFDPSPFGGWLTSAMTSIQRPWLVGVRPADFDTAAQYLSGAPETWGTAVAGAYPPKQWVTNNVTLHFWPFGNRFCAVPLRGPASGGERIRILPRFFGGAINLANFTFTIEFSHAPGVFLPLVYNAEVDTGVLSVIAPAYGAPLPNNGTSVSVNMTLYADGLPLPVVRNYEYPMAYVYFNDSAPEVNPTNLLELQSEHELCWWCREIRSCSRDCTGRFKGTAFVDACGVCSGVGTNHVAGSDIDCAGVCFGPFVMNASVCECVDRESDSPCRTIVENARVPLGPAPNSQRQYVLILRSGSSGDLLIARIRASYADAVNVSVPLPASGMVTELVPPGGTESGSLLPVRVALPFNFSFFEKVMLRDVDVFSDGGLSFSDDGLIVNAECALRGFAALFNLSADCTYDIIAGLLTPFNVSATGMSGDASSIRVWEAGDIVSVAYRGMVPAVYNGRGASGLHAFSFNITLIPEDVIIVQLFNMTNATAMMSHAGTLPGGAPRDWLVGLHQVLEESAAPNSSFASPHNVNDWLRLNSSSELSALYLERLRGAYPMRSSVATGNVSITFCRIGTVACLSPTFGAASGGTVVFVALDFVSISCIREVYFQCSFGDVRVNATFNSTVSAVQCIAPPGEARSIVKFELLADEETVQLRNAPNFFGYASDVDPILSLGNGTRLTRLCEQCGHIVSDLCIADCDGSFFGSARVDECGTCTGGSTGLLPGAYVDCRGVCFGKFRLTNDSICTCMWGQNQTVSDCDIGQAVEELTGGLQYGAYNGGAAADTAAMSLFQSLDSLWRPVVFSVSSGVDLPSDPIFLPFVFRFFGTPYRTVSISRNGALVLGSAPLPTRCHAAGMYRLFNETDDACAYRIIAPSLSRFIDGGMDSAIEFAFVSSAIYNGSNVVTERVFAVRWTNVSLEPPPDYVGPVVASPAPVNEVNRRFSFEMAIFPDGRVLFHWIQVIDPTIVFPTAQWLVGLHISGRASRSGNMGASLVALTSYVDARVASAVAQGVYVSPRSLVQSGTFVHLLSIPTNVCLSPPFGAASGNTSVAVVFLLDDVTHADALPVWLRPNTTLAVNLHCAFGGVAVPASVMKLPESLADGTEPGASRAVLCAPSPAGLAFSTVEFDFLVDGVPFVFDRDLFFDILADNDERLVSVNENTSFVCEFCAPYIPGSSCKRDCNGDIRGLAVIDECGVCSEGLTNHTSNSDKDCEGICFGPFRFYDGSFSPFFDTALPTDSFLPQCACNRVPVATGEIYRKLAAQCGFYAKSDGPVSIDRARRPAVFESFYVAVLVLMLLLVTIAVGGPLALVYYEKRRARQALVGDEWEDENRWMPCLRLWCGDLTPPVVRLMFGRNGVQYW